MVARLRRWNTLARQPCGITPVKRQWRFVGCSSAGRWQGKLAGFVCNDPSLEADAILRYFVRRWSIETTFALVRAHLGVETQRQWSDAAIRRTTPVLLGLFSLVTLLADELSRHGLIISQVSSWYAKAHPTFSDTLASVRRYLWRNMHLQTSGLAADVVKISPQQFRLWESALAWAA